MNEFLASPYVNALSCGLGVLGIILAVVFYRRGRRTKRLVFATRSFNLVSDSVSGLPGFEATYQGARLDNLTALKVLIWNSGTEIISASDVADSDPIRVILSADVAALDAQVTMMSTEANLATARIDAEAPNRVTLSFDYLGAGEGCLVSVLHMGTKDTDIAVSGTIKGHGRPQRYAGDKRNKYVSIVLTVLFWIFFLSVISTLSMHESLLSIVGTYAVLAFPTIGYLFLVDRSPRKAGSHLDKKFEDGFQASDFSQQGP